MLFGIGFVTWLMTQTLYSIGALCPYCMVVWAAMIPLFWYTTLHNLRSGVIPRPEAPEAGGPRGRPLPLGPSRPSGTR
ncbi:hypothetical protein GCM10020229_26000 [Kitasatospora albolonga]